MFKKIQPQQLLILMFMMFCSFFFPVSSENKPHCKQSQSDLHNISMFRQYKFYIDSNVKGFLPPLALDNVIAALLNIIYHINTPNTFHYFSSHQQLFQNDQLKFT